MKIGIVGPSYPFRGGIAQCTTLLYRHLRSRHNVSFYAFKRQYPAWLFPGKTDRDTSENLAAESGTEHLLDSLNPRTWLRVANRIRKQRPELVIIPWWNSFWTPQFLTIALLTRWFTNARILFICHNIFEHEARFFTRFCSKMVLRRGDLFVVHSSQEFDRLKQFIPEEKITLGFLAQNDLFEGTACDREGARSQLGVTGDVLLFFGFLRPYKGLDVLLKAMPSILQRRPVTLMIVGESWGGSSIESLARELGIARHIIRVDRYIPNQEVGLYFSAADLVVLPYLSGTGSGVVPSAYVFNTPVVATRVGSMPDAVVDGRTGFLVPPGDPAALADAVVRFFEEERSTEFRRNIEWEKYVFSWRRFVELIESAAHSTSGRIPAAARRPVAPGIEPN